MSSNAYDTYNSPLPGGAIFTSQWMDTQSFAAVCAMVTGDEVIETASFEWSDDRVNIRFVQPWVVGENPLSYGGTMSATTPTQSKYVRVVVHNGGNAQGSSWLVQTTLLATTTSGFISPLVDYPDDSDPGQTVKAVMYGRREGDVDPQYVQVAVDATGALLPGVNPLPDTHLSQGIEATLTSTLVPSFAPEERSSLSIYNSGPGNMYVRLGLDVDLSFDEYDWVVPAGATWLAPPWGGEVYIAWDDDSSGFARCEEVSGGAAVSGPAIYGASGGGGSGVPVYNGSDSPYDGFQKGPLQYGVDELQNFYPLPLHRFGTAVAVLPGFGEQRLPEMQRVDGPNTFSIIAGYKSYTMTVVGGSTVTFNSVPVPNGYTISFSASEGDTLGVYEIDCPNPGDAVVIGLIP